MCVGLPYTKSEQGKDKSAFRYIHRGRTYDFLTVLISIISGLMLVLHSLIG